MDEPILPLVEFLSTTTLFKGLDDNAIAAFAGRLQRRTYAAGEMIVRDGERGAECFIISKGEARASVRDLIDEEVDLATLVPGDTFGEVALVREGLRTASVRAHQDVEVWVLARAVFDELLQSHPRVAEEHPTAGGDSGGQRDPEERVPLRAASGRPGLGDGAPDEAARRHRR